MKMVAEEVFFGYLRDSSSSSGLWCVTVQVTETNVRFKVDMDADVTALASSALSRSTPSCLRQPTDVLYGLGRSVIGTMGQAKVDIT